MIRGILYLVVNVVILFILSAILPNFQVDSIVAGIILLIVLSLLNGIVAPILKLLAFPINLLTLGLVNGIINLLMIWAAISFVPGLLLTGDFISRFISLIVISISLSIGQAMVDKYHQS